LGVGRLKDVLPFVHAITNEVIALVTVILSFARFVSLQKAVTFIQKSPWLICVLSRGVIRFLYSLGKQPTHFLNCRSKVVALLNPQRL
jgi:hypothetical protein